MQGPQSSFKFRFVASGHTKGYFARWGSTSENGLTLAGETVPYETIKSAALRDRRFVIGFTEKDVLGPTLQSYLSEGNYIVLEIYNIEASELKRILDGAISSRELSQLRETLEACGKGDTFRQAHCPLCGAAIDLSELPVTDYTYCPYCETLFNDEGVVTDGNKYRICQCCNLYGQVRWHSEFFFYFYVVISAWRYHRRHLCSTCARSVFWRMLVGNALFIIGLPHTLLLLIRTFMGREQHLKILPSANAYLKSGKMDKATELFEQMRQHLPEHPGLLFNEAIGRLEAEEPNKALDLIQRSLESCANFRPSHEMLQRIEHIVDGTVTSHQNSL